MLRYIMALSVFVKKVGNELMPANESNQKKLESLKSNQWYKASITKARFLPLHNKYWAILTSIVENSDCFHLKSTSKGVEELHNSVKYGIDHVETIEIVSGEEKVYYRIPKPTDFQSMDNIEFEDYYNNAMNWLTVQPMLNTEGIVFE